MLWPQLLQNEKGKPTHLMQPSSTTWEVSAMLQNLMHGADVEKNYNKPTRAI
jgi:hypothetical protein